MRNEGVLKKWYGYENACFPWQSIADFRMGNAYKSTHISAVTYLRLLNLIPKIVSEYDQEIPQSQTADNPVAPRGRAAQPSRDTRKTN